MREGVESVCSLYTRGERERSGREGGLGVWMDEWMREGEKYLQSSTYNKYTANRGSKQNTVVRETREREREREMREREMRTGEKRRVRVFFLIERNKES